MGWASGSDIVIPVAQAISDSVTDSVVRERLYRVLVRAAEMGDWDCQQEAEGIDPILDEILNGD